MNVGGAALRTVLLVIYWVLDIIQWLVLVWVILSWILLFASQTSFRWKYRGIYNVLLQLNDFFSRATFPMLRPFRKILPPHKTAGIDWSPVLLLLAIFALRTFIGLAFAPAMF